MLNAIFTYSKFINSNQNVLPQFNINNYNPTTTPIEIYSTYKIYKKVTNTIY